VPAGFLQLKITAAVSPGTKKISLPASAKKMQTRQPVKTSARAKLSL
jgi:hypothetical protein